MMEGLFRKSTPNVDLGMRIISTTSRISKSRNNVSTALSRKSINMQRLIRLKMKQVTEILGYERSTGLSRKAAIKYYRCSKSLINLLQNIRKRNLNSDLIKSGMKGGGGGQRTINFDLHK